MADNVKRSIQGAYRSVSSQHFLRYSEGFFRRFNRRFTLYQMILQLACAALRTPPAESKQAFRQVAGLDDDGALDLLLDRILRTAQVCAAQVGSLHVGAFEVHVAKISAPEIGFLEVGIRQGRVSEIGFPEHNPAQRRALQH